MPIRTSEAEWLGSLREGEGHMKVGEGVFEGRYSFPSRFEEGDGTNPEELIGAAHAGCFSMALAGALGRGGHEPKRIGTTAKVNLEKVEGGFAIASIELRTEGEVPGIDEATFKETAETAKANCPVSKALAGVDISVSAKLL